MRKSNYNINSGYSADVSVLGLGNWGTTIAHHLASKGLKVSGWSKDKEQVEFLNKNHRNLRCMGEVEIDKNVKAFSDLTICLNSPYLVLALPSSALKEVLPQVSLGNTSILISAIKGVELETGSTPLQFAGRFFAGRESSMVVLSGPSFARDVIAHRPCGVVAASVSEEAAWKVAELFTADWMKVYVSTDPLGVELGGILKNVVAIAAGICDGLELGDSARTGLITRGLAEMVRLAAAMGANPQTLFGLSGLGDLVMTASSDLSRNRQVGLRLGRGESLSGILATLGSVAEGVPTAEYVRKLSQKMNVEMPISEGVAKVLDGTLAVSEGLRSLITRPIKREF